MKRKVTILIAAASLAAASCAQDGGDIRRPNVSAEITLGGLTDSTWTYFSFDKGEAIGSSRFCDAAQDSVWARRTDWDFAICGDYMKTNSGDSGNGNGGVQCCTSISFSNLETAPEDGYLTDRTIRVK